MNNSKIAIENVNLTLQEGIDISPSLRERETKLAQIIEALENIAGSKYWKVLQDNIFLPEMELLRNKLTYSENEKELFRTQGKVQWVEKYLDLIKLSQSYRNELAMIKERLKDAENN